jgi:hypothetical protein
MDILALTLECKKTSWTLKVQTMLEDHDERAVLGLLHGECRKTPDMVSAFEAKISAFEQPSMQALKGGRQFRSAPKTARERMTRLPISSKHSGLTPSLRVSN